MIHCKTLLSKIKKEIDSASIVSFDIFDTLLLRPYLKPTDLFLHLEKESRQFDFAENRIRAETIAYETKQYNDEEIIFDDIYNNMLPVYHHFKEKELMLEKQILQPNPEIMEVWKYAKQTGKKIIIVSDMYLPLNFLTDVLKEKGFGDYDTFYLSSDIKKLKWTGSMFQHILHDLKIPPQQLLHIGDNKKSDYEMPRKLQIRAILYEQVLKQFLTANPRYKIYIEETKLDFSAGIIIMVLAMYWHKNAINGTNIPYFHNFGYQIGGPIIFGYAWFIKKIAKEKGINKLFFIARDGFNIKKVFDTFGENIKTEYVYAPRFIKLITSLEIDMREKDTAKQIVDYYSKKDETISKLRKESNNNDAEFIRNNYDILCQLSAKEKEIFAKYISGLAETSEKIGVVDSGCGKFSGQRLIASALPRKKFFGFYWSVYNEGCRDFIPHCTFTQNNSDYLGLSCHTRNWNLMEFLMSAPEYPVVQITTDCMPLYSPNPSKWEEIRKKASLIMSNGILEFSNNIKHIFAERDIFLSPFALLSLANNFIDNPSKKDIYEMANIRHAGNSEHTEYLPLFSLYIPFIQFFLHPIVNKKILKQRVKWLTPLQILALNLLSPISIKIKGLKRFQIFLLPKLKNRYFTLMAHIGKYNYGFAIGNSEKQKE